MIVGILAVLFGLTGAFALKWYLHEEVVVVEVPAQTTYDVPLANSNLTPGKKLRLGDIGIVPMTREQMEERGFDFDRMMLDSRQFVGRFLKEGVVAGTPFLTTSFYPEGMGPNLADRLKPGYRAVTVPVKDAAANAGFTSPGTLVDIIFRSTPESDSHIPRATYTLIEGVEILAVNDDSTVGALGDPKVKQVTVSVTVGQAAALKSVQGRGDLSLSLRSSEETIASYRPKKVTLEGLLGVDLPPRPIVTEVYRGASRQTLKFDRQQVANEQFGGLELFSRGLHPSVSATADTADQAVTPDSTTTSGL
jgi:Flp pilus assembly protein CpaB